jgi:hypothetical protein
MSTPDRTTPPGPWHLLLGGLLLLGALIFLVSHLGEIERFLLLAERAEPLWLLGALALQLATYVSAAAAWRLALESGGNPVAMSTLLPLCVAKLFSDQALPSGGVSGTAFQLAALTRRGVAPELAMGVMLMALVCYFAACLLMDGVCVGILSLQDELHPWAIVVATLFALVAALIPGVILLLKRPGAGRFLRYAASFGALRPLALSFSAAPTALLRKPGLVLVSIMLHASVMLLDAGTLWVMFRALGAEMAYTQTLAAFLLASMTATIGIIPLGLGTFEASCVTALAMLGAPLETALTATLLLRGTTLWLPMLPGLWLMRRELR